MITRSNIRRIFPATVAAFVLAALLAPAAFARAVVAPQANTTVLVTRPAPSPQQKNANRTAPPPPPSQVKQDAGGVVRPTGSTVPDKTLPIGPVFTAGIPNVSADLTATKTTAPEFKEYLKELSGNSTLYFKLLTAAKSGQKVVWQVSGQPFTKPKDGLDWKAPAGLITSGETPRGQAATFFSIDFSKVLGAPQKKARRVYVRALAVNHNLLAAQPSNAVTFDYIADNSNIKVGDGGGGKTIPSVDSKVSVVAYAPPVSPSIGCHYILTKTPPTGELKFILAKIKATTPGAKFSLCSGDYAYLKGLLSTDEKLLLLLQDFLKALKAGYNWLDDKYNFVENKLVDGLEAAGVPKEYARYAVNSFKMAYGLNPSYGNFDEALDHGKKAFAAYLANSKDVSDKQKPTIAAKVNEFIDLVKYYANGGDDPNHFYRADPDYVPRPAYVVLRVNYQGVNNAPANMVGGKRSVKVTVTSSKIVDTHTIRRDNTPAEYPSILLFEKGNIELPAAKPGDTLDVLVYLDNSPYMNKEETKDRWWLGFNSLKPGVIQIDNGIPGISVVVSEKYPKK